MASAQIELAKYETASGAFRLGEFAVLQNSRDMAMIRFQDEPIHNTGAAAIVSNLPSSGGAKPAGLLTESHSF